MNPYIRYTMIIWGVLRLLDQGQSEPIDVVENWVEDGSLFDKLTSKYGLDVSVLDAADRAEALSLFQALNETVDARRKFGVSRNGLALVLAWATEGIQQLA